METMQKIISASSAICAVLFFSLAPLPAFASDTKCPLTEAVIKSDLAKVKKLIAKGSSVDGVDCPTPGGWPPLVYAVIGNNLALVELLLAHGANPSFRENDPLVMAAGQNRTKLVGAFLKHGVNPNVQDARLETPLYSAASCYPFLHGSKSSREEANCVDTVKALLAAGALPNTPKQHGETPLFTASYWGLSTVVKVLISQGADANVRSELDQSPLAVAIEQYAYQQYSRSMHFRLISPPMLPTIQALLEGGADPNFAYGGRWDDYRDSRNYPNTGGYTALSMVARYGWYEVAELLLQHGAQPELQREDGKLPKQIALENGHAKTARIIAKFAAHRDKVSE